MQPYALLMIPSRQLQWVLVLLMTLTAVISRLKFNGLILGFDYGIFQPDGSHYAYRTLTFLGVDPNLAANRIVDWYQTYGTKNNFFDVSLLSPENAEIWGLVAPRILYSILSMPFVYFFGIAGMMVIPIFSFVTLALVIFRLSEIYNKRGVGLILILGLTSSPTVLRWMIANITDSLLAGLFSIVALVLATNLSRGAWYFSIGTLIFLTSITRFCLPIWFAISVVFFMNRIRNRAIAIFLVSSFAFIPTYLSMPSNAVLPANIDSSGIQKSTHLFFSFVKIGFIEVAQLAALDRTLLAVLAIAVLSSILNFKQMSSQIFISILFSVWMIGAINGTLGVNFRYQLPILSFACWAIIVNLIQFPNWDAGRRINIVGKKT
jgi:hypothetical protein